MRFSPVIGLILLLAAQQPPTIAAPAPAPTKFCQTVLRDRAYGRWQRLSPWLNGEVKPTVAIPNDIANQIIERFTQAEGRPQEIVLGIDRLTLAGFGSDRPELPEGLLTLIDRVPSDQRSRLLPVIDQLVKSANALPAGYNNAQSRALITAAHAYQKLGQPSSRSLPLLQKASQTINGINVTFLRATAQWRLAQAYGALQQSNAEMAAIDQVATTIKSRPPAQPGYIGPLLDLVVDRYLSLGKIDAALAIADSLKLQDEGYRQISKVIAAYQKAKQPQKAQVIFTDRINQLSQTKGDSGNWTYGASEMMIAFAQAGGGEAAAITVAKLPKDLSHLRARVWLAIAGSARKRGQTQQATAAYQQFLAAGKARKAINFGMGFGDQRDYEWSQPLYELTRTQGYEPEMQRFIQDLQLQSEGAEFLIGEAIKAKQFDQAKRLVPLPMWRAIDAGMFEVQNQWLLKIADAAAKDGQPQQLTEFSQSLLAEMRRQDQSNIFLLRDVKELFAVLKRHQQTALIPEFVPTIVKQADFLLALPSERWSGANDIAYDLQQMGYPKEAAIIRQTIVQKLLAIADSKVRLRELQQMYQWGGTLADLVALGQQVKLDGDPEFAGWIYGKAATQQSLADREQWAMKNASTPLAKLQIFSSLGEAFLNNQQPDKAIVWFDRALAAAPAAQPNPRNSEPAFWTLINGYLYFGKIDQAKQVTKAITHPADRKLINDRLACF